MVIFDPRRDEWDANAGEELIRNQIDWELNAQEISDLIVFYFDSNTKSPITLLELGLALGQGKSVLVYCLPSYWRYENVRTTLEYFEKLDCLMRNEEELISRIKDKVTSKPSYRGMKAKPIEWTPLVDNESIKDEYADKLWNNVGKCEKCGLDLSSVMGYVCTNINCPTGLGPTVVGPTTRSFS